MNSEQEHAGAGGNPSSHRLGKVTYAIGAMATPEQGCGAASPASSISISDSSPFHLFRKKKNKNPNQQNKKTNPKPSELQTPPSALFSRLGEWSKGERLGMRLPARERWCILRILLLLLLPGAAAKAPQWGLPAPVETSGISSQAGERRGTFIAAEGRGREPRVIKGRGLHKAGGKQRSL